jgi:hypothetical protein
VIAAGQSAAPSDRDSGRAPAELISRAGLLADQLRRFDPLLETRGRIAEARAGAARPASAAQLRSASLPPGSAYRRPSAAGGRRLKGR